MQRAAEAEQLPIGSGTVDSSNIPLLKESGIEMTDSTLTTDREPLFAKLNDLRLTRVDGINTTEATQPQDGRRI
jgi:hypothetical protein